MIFTKNICSCIKSLWFLLKLFIFYQNYYDFNQKYLFKKKITAIFTENFYFLIKSLWFLKKKTNRLANLHKLWSSAYRNCFVRENYNNIFLRHLNFCSIRTAKLNILPIKQIKQSQFLRNKTFFLKQFKWKIFALKLSWKRSCLQQLIVLKQYILNGLRPTTKIHGILCKLN